MLHNSNVCRHLAGEIAAEWGESNEEAHENLMVLVNQIIPYNMAHNAEAEACDLLMEIEQLGLLKEYVDEGAYSRVCLYLTR
jgi:26S proteasome regulatory subunit N1